MPCKFLITNNTDFCKFDNIFKVNNFMGDVEQFSYVLLLLYQWFIKLLFRTDESK